LQDCLSELKHQLKEKEYQLREIEDGYNNKINELQRNHYINREESRLNKELLVIIFSKVIPSSLLIKQNFIL
jgi:hypothetical protein